MISSMEQERANFDEEKKIFEEEKRKMEEQKKQMEAEKKKLEDQQKVTPAHTLAKSEPTKPSAAQTTTTAPTPKPAEQPKPSASPNPGPAQTKPADQPAPAKQPTANVQAPAVSSPVANKKVEEVSSPVSPATSSPGGSKSRIQAPPKCAQCSKGVYPLEKIEACDKIYHKGCFRCKHCNGVLGLKGFATINNDPYCKPHYMELFKSKGNYGVFSGDEKGGTTYTGMGFVGVDVMQRDIKKEAAKQEDAAKHKEAS